MRILLVEDDPMIGASVRRGLRQDGFAIDWVQDGIAADTALAESFKLGVVVRPLASDERKAAKVDDGLVVENVDGAAERAGIRPGDIILSANGAAVNDIAALRAQVAKSPKSVALLVQRGGNRIFVPVRVG